MAFLIIGLGNPGPRYAATRHNAGYMAVEEIATATTPTPSSLSVHKKTNTLVAEATLAGHKVVLATPRSFMNNSGGAVKALSAFYKIPPQRIIVIHDELDKDLGSISCDFAGGDHGHNGLKDTTKALGTKDYYRLRIGIGRPPGRMQPARYVLAPFSARERAELPIVLANAADLAVETMNKAH